MATAFPPQSPPDVPPAADGRITPRVASARAGADWWAEGWRLFARGIGTWFGIAVVYCVLTYLMGNIPRIGDAATSLLSPVFIGGIMVGCDSLARGAPLRVAHLFEGFKRQHFVPLLLVGVFNLAIMVLAAVIGMLVIFSSLSLWSVEDLARIAADPMQMFVDHPLVGVVTGIVAILAGALIAMANWFAPALIVLRGRRPLDALLTSMRACMRNWVAFLVYGAIGIAIIMAICVAFLGLVFVAGFETMLAVLMGTASLTSIGAGLGFLGLLYLFALFVVAVVAFASSYASYRDTLAAVATPKP